MDAVEYLKQRNQMLHDKGIWTFENVEIVPEVAVEVVEKWAAEHTVTNAQKFEEVFGVNLMLENKQACPPHRYTFACDESGGDECRECQKWWDEPYTEPKGEEE